MFLSPKRHKTAIEAGEEKVQGCVFNNLLICNPCTGIQITESPLMYALNAHSIHCDAIYQNQSGRNAILSVCLLSILARDVVFTAAATVIIITDGKTPSL